KSELIQALVEQLKHLEQADVELAVKQVLERMGSTLAEGGRIEIRGFGSFSLHYRPPRVGRNPKTGEAVALPGKYVPHFKPGKELRERVNASDAAVVPLGSDGDDDGSGAGMSELGLFWLLLPVVAAASWYFARRGTELISGARVDRLSSGYFRGLSHLLNEEPDKAIEVFLSIAELDQEAVET